MPEFFSAPAFLIRGVPATWLEVIAAMLALAMVGCNMREIHWGWPQWLRGHRGDGGALRVTQLSPRGPVFTLVACALAWPAVALFPHRFTDTGVPW